MCLTPLHVLIARRIAESRGAPFSTGLYITSADNEKQRHYANVMREFCARTEYLILPGEDSYRGQKHVAIWKRRVKYRFAFRRFGRVNTVYVPSSINHCIYVLLTAVRHSELVTFDDGVSNVNPDSPLYKIHTRIPAIIFYLMAGVTNWPERIRARASNHYSIYDMENICSPVSRIKLIDGTGQMSGSAVKSAPARILFGPAPEVRPEVWEALRNAARRFALDAYLPHPRETRRMIEGIEYLETPLVAEDYILDRLRKDPNLAFQIYGYDSSALINLARTPRIEVFSLLNDTARTSSLRSLMEKSGVVMLG